MGTDAKMNAKPKRYICVTCVMARSIRKKLSMNLTGNIAITASDISSTKFVTRITGKTKLVKLFGNVAIVVK
jgi:hypothetical protein